jgi:hypothetical protein
MEIRRVTLQGSGMSRARRLLRQSRLCATAWRIVLVALVASALVFPLAASAATAGEPTSSDLVLVANGRSDAIVVRAPNSGKWEHAAAADLVKYVALMTGVTLAIADTPQSIESAFASGRPLLIIGQEALAAAPDLQISLASVLKRHPYLRTDGIVLRRAGDRVYVAGNNDEAHYFAVAELLRRWGVRWFMPGEFGECVPDETSLSVGALDYAYSSPFEVRAFWVSWLGDSAGTDLFQKRNLLTGREILPPDGHALGTYTKGLAKDAFSVALTDTKTAEQVASKVEPLYAKGQSFSLSIEDGIYAADGANDQALVRLQWDPAFQAWSVTDAALTLYANVARILRETHPDSTSRIGFLAYSNMTLPPVSDIKADPMFYASLAPIDVDPIHGMDDAQSPTRRDLLGVVQGWARVMQGRVTIYDYDQSMLVWRDLPNPSHMAFRQDVKRYRDAGILGVDTESRNALATTFINLYLRSRLLWNPDEDVESLLDDFYPRFFGPAAAAMKAYWDAIFRAWQDTIVVEHEYFVAPAIYTPSLTAELELRLREAETALEPLRAKGDALSRNDRIYLQRLRFVRLGFEVLKDYMAMVSAAATDADYGAAVEAGERGLAARDELTAMNPAFTSTRLEEGYAFWPGEVKQYRELLPLVNGDKGILIEKLPLEWSFRRDPQGDGETRGFASGPVDLDYWRAHAQEFSVEKQKDYPDQWETIRTDLYAQAQGVRFPDQRNFAGDLWYRAPLSVTAEQVASTPHIVFPGLFGACDLFVDGRRIAERPQQALWWRNDYRFQWDAPLGASLKPGDNEIALRCHSASHMGGVFRRPFVYAPR